MLQGVHPSEAGRFSTLTSTYFADKDPSYQFPRHCVAGLDDPGPGAYQATSCLGPQPCNPRSPCTRVGTATRERKVLHYLSKEHQREKLGTQSPSPHVYSPSLAAVRGEGCCLGT